MQAWRELVRQLVAASGYAAIFLVPVLLVAGLWLGTPSLAFGVVMLTFPLARSIFGTVPSGETVLWREDIATLLDRLPLLHAVVQAAMLGLVLQHIHLHGVGPAPHAIGLGLSLWVTLLFSTCVAHELIHRRNAFQALVGHGVAGLAGYPVLGHEHLVHHGRSGDTYNAEWPRLDESVWRFAYRRAVCIHADAYAPDGEFWRLQHRRRQHDGLRLASVFALATCALFAIAGGWAGAALFVGVAAGVTFGVQLITYLQHWGLGDDHLGSRAYNGYGWEDDCRFQAWITLGISLHNAHHAGSQRPFYRIALSDDSPRLPAGYIVLMLLCLCPPVWRRLMRPALEHWERHPNSPRSPGRRLTCFVLYDERPEMKITR